MTPAPPRQPLTIEFVFVLDRELEIISYYSRVGAGRRTETGRFDALAAVQSLLRQGGRSVSSSLVRTDGVEPAALALAGEHVRLGLSHRGEPPEATEQVMRRAVEAVDRRWGSVLRAGQRPAPDPAVKRLVDRLANTLESLQRKALAGKG
jgi:hypothetical protein